MNTLVIALVAVSGLVGGRILRRRLGVLLEDSAQQAGSLAFMQEGAFMTITHRKSGAFVQFLRLPWREGNPQVLFDFPCSGANAEAFDSVEPAVRATCPDALASTAKIDGRPTQVLQVVVARPVNRIGGAAMDLARQAFEAMGCEKGDRYQIRLVGRRDQDAMREHSRDNLEHLASRSIPILSRLARRELGDPRNG